MGQITILSGTATQAPGTQLGPLTLSFSGSTGQVGQSYNGALVANGGTPGSIGYTYSIVGNWPSPANPVFPGANFTTTGQITGTCNQAGTYSFTGKVTDSLNATATVACTIVFSAYGSAAAGISSVQAVQGPVTLDTSQSPHTSVIITPYFLSYVVFPQEITVWISHDNGSTWPEQYGPINILSAGQTYTVPELQPTTGNQNWKVAACMGTIGSMNTLPTAAVQSPTFVMATMGVPSATAATLSISGPIQMVDPSSGQQFFDYIISIQTPGNTDPKCWCYEVTIEQVNISGVAAPSSDWNTVGHDTNGIESRMCTFDNDGTFQTYTLESSYAPSGSTYTYLQFKVYAISRSITSTLGWQDPTYSTPEQFTGGLTYFRSNFGALPSGPIATQGDNKCVNGSFGQGLTGWTQVIGSTVSQGVFTTSTAQYHSSGFATGSSALCSILPGVGSENYLMQSCNCNPGDAFAIYAWYYTSPGAVGLGNVQLAFYDISNTYIGGTDVSGAFAVTNGVWEEMSTVSAAAPSNAVQVRWLVGVSYYTGASGNWYFDDVSVIRLSPGQGLKVNTTSGKMDINAGSGITTTSGAVAINYGQAVADDGSGKLTVLVTGPILSTVSGLNLNVSSDFVVSGGALTQNAINLAKAYNFNTSQFTTSGGSMAIQALSVGTLIAGNAFVAGTMTFAYSPNATSGSATYCVNIGAAGLTMWDNYTTPLTTYTLTSAGSTLSNVNQTFPVWVSGTSYILGSEVLYNNQNYVSLVNPNLNHHPDISPTYWQATNCLQTTASGLGIYSAGATYISEVTIGSGGLAMQCSSVASGISSVTLTSSAFTMQCGNGITGGITIISSSGGGQITINPGATTAITVANGQNYTSASYNVLTVGNNSYISQVFPQAVYVGTAAATPGNPTTILSASGLEINGVWVISGSTWTGTAISGGGFTQQINAVTAKSYSSGNWYQNTSGKTQLHSVCIPAWSAATTTSVYCDSTSGNTTIVGYVSNADPSYPVYSTVTFVVLPNYWFKVNGTVTVYSWFIWQ